MALLGPLATLGKAKDTNRRDSSAAADWLDERAARAVIAVLRAPLIADHETLRPALVRRVVGHQLAAICAIHCAHRHHATGNKATAIQAIRQGVLFSTAACVIAKTLARRPAT